MQIVFDSSTLILLAKAGLLDVFMDDFPGHAWISKTVEKECLAKPSVDAKLIQSRIREGRIKVSPVRDNKLCSKMENDFNINRGEAEAVVMGAQFKAIVATDDWNAIQACKVLRLPFTTALALLIRMREKNLLDKDLAISKLGALTEFGRYGADVIQTVTKILEA